MTGRVLVTGADGFIGSHLTEALVEAGHDVRAMVQNSISAGAAQFTTLSMAEQHADALDSVETSFSDLERWKRRQRYR